MDVILLEKVENLGGIGDKVTVKAGYGRNFLLPKGKAKLATKVNLAEFEALRSELEKKAADELAVAEKRGADLADSVLEITAKAGTEGKLFGSIGNIDITNAFEEKGVSVARAEIRLSDGPLREAGEHTVGLHLHSDVDVEFIVKIIAED